MKILRITAQGLPLFKTDLDICFYTQQRVCEEDKDSLYRLTDNYYLHSACSFIGINASGKTSVLKVISLALNLSLIHIFCSSVAGLPVPFAPVHLLFINLLTDSLPAIALGLEPVSYTHLDVYKRQKSRI